MKTLESEPTRLELWRELKKRGVEQEGYEQLEKGAGGEEFVMDMLATYGQSHWVVLRNLWLDCQGPFECDLAVITHAGFYPFEIKNYAGHFQFLNGNCLLNQKKIGYNPIYQANKSAVNMENMLREKFPSIHVGGALLFVGEHNMVEVHDSVDNIRIVMRNELRNFIWDIANQERHHQGPILNKDAILKWLEKYKTDNPFGPDPVSSVTADKLHKGICCSHCGSFELDTSKAYISCSCGMHEPRETAIVRTICEYGVIHYDKDLVTTDVLAFFDGQISRTNLLIYLNRHFTKLGKKKGARFLNKARPIHIVRDEFSLIKSSYLEIKD